MKLKNFYAVAFLGLTIIFTSCGGKKKDDVETISDKDNAFSAMEKLSKNVDKMKEKTDEADKVIAERKAKGDTLAMPYKELEKFLPDAPSGYKKDGDPKGQTVNMAGSSYTEVEQNYKKDDSNTLRVKIVDYNATYGTFQGLYAMAGMFSIDSDDERTGKTDIGVDKTTAIESFKKKTKDATLSVGTGYRFWVEVSANNQTETDFVKSVAKSINLAELSKK